MKKELLTNQELYEMNTISVKVEMQKRNYYGIGNVVIVKDINRTKYLKICWMCGKPYETYKHNSFACQARCSNNIVRFRKNGVNPPANMLELTKPKNVKEIKELFGYR